MAMQERTSSESGTGSAPDQIVDRLVQFRSAMMRMAQELAELRRENRLLRIENESLRGRRFGRDAHNMS